MINPRAGARRGGALAVLAALFFLPLTAGQAHAEDAYQYWSYWWGNDGSWEYASTGPADRIVEDGDIEGWVFLVSSEAEPSQEPAAAPNFTELCADTPEQPGQVRVGVVIDYGSSQDSPAGSEIPAGDNPSSQCAVVPQGSTGEQALAAAAEVRSEQGITCGISGYPATGCFEVVSAPAPETAEEPASEFPVWPVVAGVVVLSALIVLLVARKKNPPAA
jgi:hypothetical protein